MTTEMLVSASLETLEVYSPTLYWEGLWSSKVATRNGWTQAGRDAKYVAVWWLGRADLDGQQLLDNLAERPEVKEFRIAYNDGMGRIRTTVSREVLTQWARERAERQARRRA